MLGKIIRYKLNYWKNSLIDMVIVVIDCGIAYQTVSTFLQSLKVECNKNMRNIYEKMSVGVN